MTDDSATPISAGQLLREAREQRNLSLQQVAVQLNLKPEQVAKLEQDELVGSLETYSRGYMRAYGRLLKLPEAKLKAALMPLPTGQLCDAKPMRTFSNRTAKQATESRFVWLTYGIIALLLLLLGIWWWQTDKLVVNDNEATTLVESEPVTVAVTDVVIEAAPQQLEVEPLPLLLPQLEPEVTAKLVDAAPELELAQLEMRFSENCWVDVIDAEGNRVAFGTKLAGYVMQLSGKSPFVVTLGNPSAVKINFNKQAVDMSAHTAGRVTKFTIPEPG